MTRSRFSIALASSLLALAIILAFPIHPARADSGRGTLYSVASLGGSPPTYRLTVNTTAGVTVGDHVMARVAAGRTGLWIVTAKTATTITVEDSLTEANGAEVFGPPVAGGADSVFAFASPAANGTTPIPDASLHWAAALRRNDALAATTGGGTGAALTRTNDTNVTLTLGGSPSTALLDATSITLGWTGTLAESRGGTGAASLSSGIDAAFGSTRGSVLYRGASGWTSLAPGTSGHALTSNGAGADPSYQAATAPTLAQVLASGADGNAVDLTNLGSLTLAASEGVNTPGALTITTGSSTGVLLAQGGASEGLIFEGTGTNGARLRVTGDPATLLVRTGDDSAAGRLSADTLTSSTSMTSPAYILGTADTSGVRLDIESGRIAIREGDDSNYNSMNLFKALASDSLVIGAETTSGIRLDLVGSTLAVREGDDSAYGPMAALSALFTDSVTVGSADTSGVRLDIEGSTLAIREGDDSAYVGLNCGSLNLGGSGNIAAFRLATDARTADATLASTQSGRVHTNEGAAGAVNLTLPAAISTTGYVIEAVVQANQYLRFTAATGDTIRDGATVSASAGYIRSTTVGSAIRLYCINATEWIVLSKTGTWTVDS